MTPVTALVTFWVLAAGPNMVVSMCLLLAGGVVLGREASLEGLGADEGGEAGRTDGWEGYLNAAAWQGRAGQVEGGGRNRTMQQAPAMAGCKEPC